jgi:flagellar motility protein MotE (MotC chaperone)
MVTRHERFCGQIAAVMMDRQRLIPAVILGAVGLLALKAISWTDSSGVSFVPLADQVAPRTAVVHPDGSYNPNDFRGMVQMLARAREPYIITSPEVTGSVPAKDADKKDAKAPDGKTPDGKTPDGKTPDGKIAEAASQPMPTGPKPKDRASVMNQGERTPSTAERELIERLGERREQIDARQRELDLREKLLETAERKLDGRVEELKAVEDKLEGKKDEKDSGETQGLKKLVIMYENMKPKDAARVFDRLPSDVLVPMVLQMNPRKMSEVMASMSAEAAEKLTVALAVRARARSEGGAAPALAAPAGPNELQAITPAQPARRP